VIGQAAIVVFEASRHKDIATDFVAFMTNKENVTRMAEFFPPARISVLESETFLESNPLIDPESMQQAVAAAIQQGAVLPTHVEFPKIDLTAGAEFDRLWVPEADVQTILTDICESIAPFLGQ
ncbi:MAG: sugar ABC transporter substrate-binding protein, partial [bacterium]|nr:sugar ABC transporter substrate-binding protein [bacterium]